jgi:hypothetical protein
METAENKNMYQDLKGVGDHGRRCGESLARMHWWMHLYLFFCMAKDEIQPIDHEVFRHAGFRESDKNDRDWIESVFQRFKHEPTTDSVSTRAREIYRDEFHLGFLLKAIIDENPTVYSMLQPAAKRFYILTSIGWYAQCFIRLFKREGLKECAEHLLELQFSAHTLQVALQYLNIVCVREPGAGADSDIDESGFLRVGETLSDGMAHIALNHVRIPFFFESGNGGFVNSFDQLFAAQSWEGKFASLFLIYSTWVNETGYWSCPSDAGVLLGLIRSYSKELSPVRYQYFRSWVFNAYEHRGAGAQNPGPEEGLFSYSMNHASFMYKTTGVEYYEFLPKDDEPVLDEMNVEPGDDTSSSEDEDEDDEDEPEENNTLVRNIFVITHGMTSVVNALKKANESHAMSFVRETKPVRFIQESGRNAWTGMTRENAKKLANYVGELPVISAIPGIANYALESEMAAMAHSTIVEPVVHGIRESFAKLRGRVVPAYAQAITGATPARTPAIVSPPPKPAPFDGSYVPETWSFTEDEYAFINYMVEGWIGIYGILERVLGRALAGDRRKVGSYYGQDSDVDICGEMNVLKISNHSVEHLRKYPHAVAGLNEIVGQTRAKFPNATPTEITAIVFYICGLIRRESKLSHKYLKIVHVSHVDTLLSLCRADSTEVPSSLLHWMFEMVPLSPILYTESAKLLSKQADTIGYLVFSFKAGVHHFEYYSNLIYVMLNHLNTWTVQVTPDYLKEYNLAGAAHSTENYYLRCQRALKHAKDVYDRRLLWFTNLQPNNPIPSTGQRLRFAVGMFDRMCAEIDPFRDAYIVSLAQSRANADATEYEKLRSKYPIKMGFSRVRHVINNMKDKRPTNISFADRALVALMAMEWYRDYLVKKYDTQLSAFNLKSQLEFTLSSANDFDGAIMQLCVYPSAYDWFDVPLDELIVPVMTTFAKVPARYGDRGPRFNDEGRIRINNRIEGWMFRLEEATGMSLPEILMKPKKDAFGNKQVKELAAQTNFLLPIGETIEGEEFEYYSVVDYICALGYVQPNIQWKSICLDALDVYLEFMRKRDDHKFNQLAAAQWSNMDAFFHSARSPVHDYNTFQLNTERLKSHWAEVSKSILETIETVEGDLRDE